LTNDPIAVKIADELLQVKFIHLGP